MIKTSILVLICVAPIWAQNLQSGGFFEDRTLLYPQSAPNDNGYVVNDALFRWEGSYKAASWLTFSSALDFRTDSHRQVEREWRFDVDDRSTQRPAFSLRQMNATIHKGRFTAELGRQFIRWGKADILNPTDRFAPKDYLSNVVDADYLGVAAARLTVTAGSNTLDLVWQPWFTPSRIPLLDQRWTTVPEQFAGFGIVNGGARYPGGSQYGARWNHIGSKFEYSACFFDGFNNLPSFGGTVDALLIPTISLQRIYPRLRLYGGDAALPLPWFTVKGEAAYYTAPDHDNDEFIIYVVQVERQIKEWFLVGGYAGDESTKSTNSLQFSPERGFARSFIGRAGWTIDSNRSLTVTTAVRAAGSFLRSEYSQAVGQHWRATAGATWIRGDITDFLGQYRRNSYLSLTMRYSF